jgi:predicted  nucleic acid-binding Zn-ribbon protein
VDDLVTVLAKFHRDVLLPDVERIVQASEQRVTDRMDGLFDALSKRIDRLETEYQMIVAGMKRIEERLDKMVLRSEFLELKGRVDQLQERLRHLATQIQD